MRREPEGDIKTGQPSLSGIPQENRITGPPSQQTHRIGGSGIATAGIPEILTREAGEEGSGQEGSQKVGDEQCQKDSDHESCPPGKEPAQPPGEASSSSSFKVRHLAEPPALRNSSNGLT